MHPMYYSNYNSTNHKLWNSSTYDGAISSVVM